MMGIIGRFKLLYYYIFFKECRKNTTLKDLFWHFSLSKCENLVKDYAVFISKDDKYTHYSINGIEGEFKYPNSVPYHNFAQVVAEGMLKKHWHYYEINKTRVLDGDIVVDCGSAEGFFAFKNKKKAGKIYLIEPLPVFCDSLKANFDSYENIQICNVALGSESGTAIIELNEQSPIASKIFVDATVTDKSKQIPLQTIDSLFVEKNIKIDYLKADLEGFEESMIKGAIKTITDSKPKIAITTYHKGQNAKILIDLIKSHVPEYNYILKGIESFEGKPVMLHMWV
jgi:FkbM family methyltransferase